MKLFKPTNLKTIKNYIISKNTIIFLAFVLGISDFTLSKPLYVYVLDMPEMGYLLALTFAIIIAFLPKTTAQLFARKQYWLGLISILFGIGLMSFIYVGQYELTQILAGDSLEAILNEGIVIPKSESNRHRIATALTALLYGIATFVSYLYYAENENRNPKTGHQFNITRVYRYLQASLLKLEARFQRALTKPTHLAEATINSEITECKKGIQEQEQKLTRETIFYSYECQHLTHTEKQIKNAIHLVYRKKSFFHFLKPNFMKSNQLSNVKSAILVLAFSLTSAFTNAQNLEEFYAINDTSISNPCQLDARAIFAKIISDFELKKYPNKGVVVRTSFCGAGRIPEVHLANLPEVPASFFGGSRSERKKALYAFLAKAKLNLDILSNHPCDDSQTNLYRTIVYLSKLYSSNSKTKSLVIFSDMAECSSVFDAGRYIHKPEALLEDYDRIVAAFEKDAPLPNLKGVDITIVNPMDSGYLLYLSRFWKRLLISCGAKFVNVSTAF